MLKGENRYKHIIWDWNGTLLNDVNCGIEVMNNMLKNRGLPLLDIKRYKDIFTFPVKEYYKKLGFDFNTEPYETLATEYISEFNSDKHKFYLYDKARDILDFNICFGISQSILSASEEQALYTSVNKFSIGKYFVKIAGLNNHYADSKAGRGKYLLDALKLQPEQVLLIGDTIHDYDVSREIGCDCLLISNGHQSYKRLSKCETTIIKTISEVPSFIKGKVIN